MSLVIHCFYIFLSALLMLGHGTSRKHMLYMQSRCLWYWYEYNIDFQALWFSSLYPMETETKGRPLCRFFQYIFLNKCYLSLFKFHLYLFINALLIIGQHCPDDGLVTYRHHAVLWTNDEQNGWRDMASIFPLLLTWKIKIHTFGLDTSNITI